MTAADRLSRLLEITPPALTGISDEEASRRVADGKWSSKEILGHLIDSAGNNHQRIVRALITPRVEFPPYQQESWVSVQAYASESWSDLVSLWLHLNRHLLHVIQNVPDASLSHLCVIGGQNPMPLSALIDSYVDHLEHHLVTIRGDLK